MDAATAQAELRHSFVHGGPGAIVSGIIWLIAGVVAITYGIAAGFTTLFFGGMLIFPISATIVRSVCKRPAPSKLNPGGTIVLETVVPMIGGFFAAWLLMPHRPDYVFPISAIAVGAHYFGFRTAYGDMTYWVFGGVLCAIAYASLFINSDFSGYVPFAVAIIEFGFGIWFVWADVTRAKEQSA